MSLTIRPITLRKANAYVAQNHRHNLPVNGHKWSIACYDGERLCGVAIAGQPIARKLDDGLTIEIRRVCTDGTYNACSMLYGAASRVAKAMGYKRAITYTLQSEPGTSLKASGWIDCGEAGGYRGICRADRGKNTKKRYLAWNENTQRRRSADGKKDSKEGL